MFGSYVPRRGTEWKFGIKAGRPAIAATVAVGAPYMVDIFFGEVNPGIVPWVAIATIARFHGDERRL